ncbi:MAG: tyrosine-type recombinase/integrase [Rhodobacteraceae bacterium]|nr:tyrosine-type recombinase/integrase [Paracoccaceae bacterium]
MIRRKNPFPGVTRSVDRHGRVRWRFRKAGFSTYLPGEYGSAEFRAAYEAAQAERPSYSTAPPNSMAWLIEAYLASPDFAELAESSKRPRRRVYDWLRKVAGHLPYKRCTVQGVEKLMDKKDRPNAANTVAKRLSVLFVFACRKGWMKHNPAKYAKRRKVSRDGFDPFTAADIDRFRQRWPSGSKARLAFELALNTGAARQDLARLGWQNVQGGRIRYRRGKTGIEADLPILPELAAELRHAPTGQLLFLTHGQGKGYTTESLGNLFRRWCTAAGVPIARAHGVRKAGATRLAHHGASEAEIMAYLAHKDTRMASIYFRKAQRGQLADSAFSRLGGAEPEQNLSNLGERLDKPTAQATDGNGKNG